MRLYFEGHCSGESCWINEAVFETKNGKEIIVDRNTTRYSVKDGNFEMEWRECYIWDDNQDPDSITLANYNDLDDCKFVRLELEDDVDPEFGESIEIAVSRWCRTNDGDGYNIEERNSGWIEV